MEVPSIFDTNHPKPSAKAAVSGCGPCAGMIMVYLFHENDGCAE
jgi:hypothetical protein